VYLAGHLEKILAPVLQVHQFKITGFTIVFTVKHFIPQQFTIKNVLQPIEKKQDLHKGVFDQKIKRSNSKVLKQFL